MANQVKITELTAATEIQTGDLVPIVDVSDTTQAASGSTKKASWAVLQAGLTGDTGIQGDTGVGEKGDTGDQGDTGIGAQGDTGVGTQGDTGEQGDTGVGTQGDTGVGEKGDTGEQGDTGVGTQGDTGIGEKGDTGNQGDTGVGVQGDTGVGEKGDTGDQGDTGIGIQGDTGVGEQGDTGAQGDTGVGEKGDTGEQGDTGADSTVQGDTGEQGDTGVGTQGDTGVGEKGDTGEQGDTGVGTQGDTGVGTQGDTGIQGDTGAGIQGDTGDQGDTGVIYTWQGEWATSTVYALYDTVEQAGSGYVCIEAHTSGTFSVDLAAGKWELFVEAGPAGDTGTQGDTGVAGDTGAQQVSLQVDQSGGTSDTYGSLSGTINGSNTTFTVSLGAYVSGSLQVYLNGQLQTQGTSEDWDETTPASGTFDFNTAPISGDEITVYYQYTASGSGNADTLDGYHASSFQLGSDGWTSAGETWTYSSVDDPTGVITVPSDATTKYSVGMRIKFTNATNTVYGIITALTSTTITFLHEIDPSDNQALHLMANSAITSNYYSFNKAPFGFPTDARKWTILYEDTTTTDASGASVNTWTNVGSHSQSIPIGSWDLSYSVQAEVTDAGSGGGQTIATTLSTANNTESDITFTARGYHNLGTSRTSQQIRQTFSKRSVIVLSSKTTYYINLLSPTADGALTLSVKNADGAMYIMAICTYL